MGRTKIHFRNCQIVFTSHLWKSLNISKCAIHSPNVMPLLGFFLLQWKSSRDINTNIGSISVVNSLNEWMNEWMNEKFILLSYTTFINENNDSNRHDNEEMRGDENTHSKGEWVKMPLLPNKVGKRSGTVVTTWVV